MSENKKLQNIFSDSDHTIVRSAVRGLPGLLSYVMVMRFWENKSIAEIAFDIGVSVTTVEKAITKASRLLRAECLKNPTFSRSLYGEIQRLGFDLAA